MAKYKLTPQEHKEIVLSANALPQIQRVNTDGSPQFRNATKYQGAEYNEATKMITKNSLHGKEPVLINHKIEMIRHFENGGELAVKHYVLMIHAISNKPKDEVQR